MARRNKVIEIDNRIKKKQEKLFSLKEQSDAIAAEIEKLLMEKKEAQKTELIDAFGESGRTYDEVMEFLRSAPKRTANEATGARRGRPKRVKTDD